MHWVAAEIANFCKLNADCHCTNCPEVLVFRHVKPSEAKQLPFTEWCSDTTLMEGVGHHITTDHHFGHFSSNKTRPPCCKTLRPLTESWSAPDASGVLFLVGAMPRAEVPPEDEWSQALNGNLSFKGNMMNDGSISWTHVAFVCILALNVGKPVVGRQQEGCVAQTCSVAGRFFLMLFDGHMLVPTHLIQTWSVR